MTAERAGTDPLRALGSAIEADGGLGPGAFAIAASLHIAFALVIPHRAVQPPAAAPSALVVDVVDIEPPPVHDEVPPAAPPSAEASKTPAPKHDVATSPAQAAKVLARDEHASDPLDLTGDFV